MLMSHLSEARCNPMLCNHQRRSHTLSRLYVETRSRKALRVLPRAQGSRDSNDKQTSAPDKDLGIGLKAAWFGAELLGDLNAKFKQASSPQGNDTGSSSSRATMTKQQQQQAVARSVSAVLESIRADYDAEYFISGKGEMAAYDPDCLFKDDFASFRGVERFKKNVSNLGALLSDVDLQITKWDVGESSLEAHWRFSGILNLPWKPRLAAAGSTTHVIDTDRGLVVEHIEKWKSEPQEVIARLLKPAAKTPSTPWEVFMSSLSSGNYKVAWYVVSRRVTFIAVPVLVAAVAVHALTGHGLPGIAGGSVVEVLAGVLFTAGLLTEVAMYLDGIGTG